MLKLGLILVMLHALHEAHSYRNVLKGWDITAPQRVRATRGSCLVIPCSYTFPKTFRIIKNYRGLWKEGSRGLDVAASRANYPIHPDYNRRTLFLGQVWRKSCTWMLAGVRDSDAGLYFFRIELPEYKSYSWKSQTTEVQVVGAKRPDLKLSGGSAGRDVLAYCSVTHSCPKSPPTLTWNRNETALSGSYRASDWQWMTYSILQLHPQNTTQELRCTVTYYGGERLYSTVRYG